MAIGGLLTLCVGLIGSLGVLTSEVIKGINNADVADFIFVNGTDKFRCYITDETNKYISIGWGREAKEAPADLGVPEIMTNNGVDYTVKGIVQGGFRSCDFETISLPNTITEIEEEAFAYCDQLKTFTLPSGVTEIKGSTFIDCRKMTYFLYKNNNGSVISTNDKVTRIGSHAFASCVSLLDFSFPSVLQRIDECAFQKCTSFTRIYLPSAEFDEGSTTPKNQYTIGKYAFADCSKLEFVYFEKNLTNVDSYAFVDCYIDDSARKAMTLHYGYSGSYPGNPRFTTSWRKKRLDTGISGDYTIESDHIIIRQHHEFPGLRFSIETKPIVIDCSKSDTVNKIVLETPTSPYISIYQWNAPPDKGTAYTNYYNTETKALEIPGQIKIDETTTYPVKVINKAAFANKADDIYSLKFNSGLVQICKEAFLKDTEIKSIDFTNCDTLLEISNDIFNQRNGTRNSYVTSLELPHTLEYIGMYAFWAFDKVETLKFTTDENDPNKKPHLKVLGGACFGELGKLNGLDANHRVGIEVTLPGSLDDRAAIAANINYDRNKDYNEQNWAAIGPYVFGSTVNNANNTSQVTVVTMDQNPTPGLSCSLAPNAMNRARRLVKFVANSNLAMVGSEVFKNCNDLREVFLTTAKGKALADAGMQYPWGSKAADGSTYESSILSSGGDGDKPDLVLYLDGPAPGKISTTEMTDVKVKWNSETSRTYNTEFGYNSDVSNVDINYMSRSSNPTFINTDFNFANGSLLYWKPNSTGGGAFTDAPSTLSEYNQGVITLVKQKGSDHYVVARYFAANNKVVDEIDLTGLVHKTFGNISSKITEIGDEAFAVNSANKKGYYFILPHTVTKISERAFFRKVDVKGKVPITTVGARIVTYRDAEGNVQPAPSGESYADAKTRCINAGSTTANIYGYCVLPNQLTHLGRFAFYSNVFKEVWIPKTLSFFGVGAFYSHLSNNVASRLQTIIIENNDADEDEDPETESNPNFKLINNGIYYVGSATEKTLLYQAQNIEGTEDTLTIDGGTKAIGMAACAGTKYKTINLNSELKTIYGSAFESNVTLTTVTGGANLEYISAIAADSADEVYQDNDYYQNIDYRDYYGGDYAIRASRKTAFRNCSNLTTFNFKALTKLKKIGHGAFINCNNLEHLAGGDTYKYYVANSDGTVPVTASVTMDKGVLDLSPCTQLEVIGANSFTSSKIKYVHLPYSNGELSVARDKTNDELLGGDDDKQPIFKGTTPTYLLGDIAYKTYRGNDAVTSVNKDKWSNVWYGSDRNKVYFHAASKSDLLSGNSEANLRYWIDKPGESGSYILFNSYSIAKN